MDLQINKIHPLSSMGISIIINNNRNIEMVSETKEIDSLQRTEVTILENEEVGLTIQQDGSKLVKVSLPGYEEEIVSNNESEIYYDIYKFQNNDYFPWS